MQSDVRNFLHGRLGEATAKNIRVQAAFLEIGPVHGSLNGHLCQLGNCTGRNVGQFLLPWCLLQISGGSRGGVAPPLGNVESPHHVTISRSLDQALDRPV